MEREYEFYKSETRSHPIIEKLRYPLECNIGAEDLKATLYTQVGSDYTALHFAIEYGSNFLADRIFEMADEKLDTNERKELIQSTSPSGVTILNRAAHNDETVNSLCKFLVRQPDLVSDVKRLFLIPGRGYNFFTYAAMNSRNCLLVVLNCFKNNSSHDELRKIFFERNITSKILARDVAEFCDEGLTKKFFDFC